MRRAGLFLACLSIASCNRSDAPQVTGVGDDETCVVLRTHRVCAAPPSGPTRRGAACAAGLCVTPAAPPPRIGPRASFRCDGGVCVDTHPRHPDDGEWECSERAGVVVCKGGLPAAGVSAGTPDARWRCAPYRGADAAAGSRVCVDYAPDEPPPGPTRERFGCELRYVSNLPQRVCSERRDVRVGDPCGSCPEGAACVGAVCVPLTLDVACFFDHDCPSGRPCRFGGCLP